MSEQRDRALEVTGRWLKSRGLGEGPLHKMIGLTVEALTVATVERLERLGIVVPEDKKAAEALFLEHYEIVTREKTTEWLNGKN